MAVVVVSAASPIAGPGCLSVLGRFFHLPFTLLSHLSPLTGDVLIDLSPGHPSAKCLSIPSGTSFLPGSLSGRWTQELEGSTQDTGLGEGGSLGG